MQAADLRAHHFFDSLRQPDLLGAENAAVFIGIEHGAAIGHIGLPLPQHQQVRAAVGIHIRSEELGIDGIDQLLALPIGKGENSGNPHHLVAQAAAYHQLAAGFSVHIHIVHLLEGCAIHLEHLHKEVSAVLRLVKDQDFQGLLGIAPGENDIFLFSVPVQVSALHHLLVVPVGGRCKLQPFHGLLNGLLQQGILLGPAGNGIHLLHGPISAAGKQRRRQDKTQKQHSSFQGISSPLRFSFRIYIHYNTNF